MRDGWAEIVRHSITPVWSDGAERRMHGRLPLPGGSRTEAPARSPIQTFGRLLGDNAAVTALLDRLLHQAHVLKCGPRRWRTKVQTTLRTREAVKQNSTPVSGRRKWPDLRCPEMAGWELSTAWS